MMSVIHLMQFQKTCVADSWMLDIRSMYIRDADARIADAEKGLMVVVADSDVDMAA